MTETNLSPLQRSTCDNVGKSYYRWVWPAWYGCGSRTWKFRGGVLSMDKPDLQTVLQTLFTLYSDTHHDLENHTAASKWLTQLQSSVSYTNYVYTNHTSECIFFPGTCLGDS